MRILFISPGLGFGGAERVMSILANRFEEIGYVVIFLLMDDEKRVSYSLNNRVEIIYSETARFRRISDFSKIIRKVSHIVYDINPDVIISFFNATTVFAAYAAKKMKIPIIFSERNDPYNNIKGLKASIFQRCALALANKVVFQTEKAREYYGKNIIKKSCVILNPFDKRVLPAHRYSGKPKKEIVSVGRLTKQKNQALLIKAFALLHGEFPDYVLKIYGDGPLKEELMALSEEMNIVNYVNFMGKSTCVLSEIDGSTLFVLTSDYEGLPNALIEAMAMGLPCVSTDCSPGGAAILINNYENGILVKCGDERALSEAMKYILCNKEKANVMGGKASDIIERLDAQKITEQWNNEIKALILRNKSQ